MGAHGRLRTPSDAFGGEAVPVVGLVAPIDEGGAWLSRVWWPVLRIFCDCDASMKNASAVACSCGRHRKENCRFIGIKYKGVEMDTFVKHSDIRPWNAGVIPTGGAQLRGEGRRKLRNCAKLHVAELCGRNQPVRVNAV